MDLRFWAWKNDDFWRFFVASIAWECSEVKKMGMDIVFSISEISIFVFFFRSKFFLRCQLVLCRKTAIFAPVRNNRESNRNLWYYQSGRVQDLATQNELTSQKKIRGGNFWFFIIFRNVINDVHAGTFDLWALLRDARHEKPPKIIDFPSPEPQIHCFLLDFLVRTYLVQPPCLL